MSSRPVWSLALLSLELRILTALLWCLYVAYRAHAIDELVRLYFQSNLEKKFKLPIEIDAVRIDVLNGRLLFSGCRMLAPPRSKDKRWKFGMLMSAKHICIICDPAVFLYFFLRSGGKVVSAVGVLVQGVAFNLEGFEPSSLSKHADHPDGPPHKRGNRRANSAAAKIVYNFKLIGGEVKTRQRRRKPTQRDLKVQERDGRRGRSVPLPPPSEAGNPSRHLEVSGQVVREDKKPIRSSLMGMMSKAGSYIKEAENKGGLLKYTSNSLSKIMTDYSAEVARQGGLAEHVKSKASSVLQATAARIDVAYKSAKEKIRASYELKICEFHERLRGGEPIPDSRDGYVHLLRVTVLDIEVQLRNVLPSRLRPLEKSSFFVPKLDLPVKEYCDLNSVIDQVGKLASIERALLALYETLPADLRARLDFPAAVGASKSDIAALKKAGPGDRPQSEQVDAGNLNDPDHGSGGEGLEHAQVSGPEVTPLQTLLYSLYGGGHRAANLLHAAALRAMHYDVRGLQRRLAALEETSRRACGGLQGLPLCVLIYRLERTLLSEMLKDNAGRVINDTLSDLWIGAGGAVGSGRRAHPPGSSAQTSIRIDPVSKSATVTPEDTAHRRDDSFGESGQLNEDLDKLLSGLEDEEYLSDSLEEYELENLELERGDGSPDIDHESSRHSVSAAPLDPDSDQNNEVHGLSEDAIMNFIING